MPLPIRVFLCVGCRKIRPIAEAQERQVRGRVLRVCQACVGRDDLV